MVRSKVFGLVFLASALASQPIVAQPVMLVIERSADLNLIAGVGDAQDSLVAAVRRDWRAELATFIPGWQQAKRDAERASGLRWRGLPAVFLRVPDEGRLRWSLSR